MTATFVRVAIPVLRGKRRFHLDKGRQWSIVEHLILVSVAEKPKTVAELAAAGDLPRRLVIEVIVRLMRAGWIELSQVRGGTLFSASRAGRDVVSLAELPTVPKRVSRWMNFVIDRLTGTLYRSRELPFFESHVLVERAKREPIVFMEPRAIEVNDGVSALVGALFGDDERFVSMDPAGDRLVERYALVSVRNAQVEGLPQRAPAELRLMILNAGLKASARPLGDQSPRYDPAPIAPLVREQPTDLTPIFFQSSDLILGDSEHEALLIATIKKCRYRLIIHSTFISEDKFSTRKEILLDAARRGVKIDVMWGEDETRSLTKSTRVVVGRLRQQLDSEGYASAVRVHPFSTGSHAKLLVADDGNAERYISIIGSCNWLASGFDSFESSAKLRDPQIVASTIEHLAELSRGSDGHWTELTNELARLAVEIRRRPKPGSIRGEASLVLGPQHAHFVRRARDEAARRMIITSHRFSSVGRPAVVIPAIAAAEARGVDVRLYYGRTSGNLQGEDAADIVRAASERGVKILPIHEPRLHAKILAWDDDFIVVSSQNWLSADPSEANLRKEIGIFLHATGVSRVFSDRLEAARRDW